MASTDNSKIQDFSEIVKTEKDLDLFFKKIDDIPQNSFFRNYYRIYKEIFFEAKENLKKMKIADKKILLQKLKDLESLIIFSKIEDKNIRVFIYLYMFKFFEACKRKIIESDSFELFNFFLLSFQFAPDLDKLASNYRLYFDKEINDIIKKNNLKKLEIMDKCFLEITNDVSLEQVASSVIAYNPQKENILEDMEWSFIKIYDTIFSDIYNRYLIGNLFSEAEVELLFGTDMTKVTKDQKQKFKECIKRLDLYQLTYLQKLKICNTLFGLFTDCLDIIDSYSAKETLEEAVLQTKGIEIRNKIKEFKL
jgi:hypothetical protein